MVNLNVRKLVSKRLSVGLKKTGGRSNTGRITSRHRGGGHKRRYRVIDFNRGLLDVPGIVQYFEYDPNRSAYLACIFYSNFVCSFILALKGMKVGDTIVSSNSSTVYSKVVGSSQLLGTMLVGQKLSNVEFNPGRGGAIGRAAGTYVQKLGDMGKYSVVRLPSGEVRLLLANCRCTLGIIGNDIHNKLNLGKAGKSKHLGRLPQVRGVAKNPVDHPHGGGEGRTSGGRPSVSPWGLPTKGGYSSVKKSRFVLKTRKEFNN